MNAKEEVRISKLLSLVLRHRPETLDLQLDESGWISCDALLKALAKRGNVVNFEQLRQLVENSDKQRFALSADGKRIRANQGHSVSVELELPQESPPDRLYHGTVERFLESIHKRGLIRGRRHHVHLSQDRSTARQVAMRRGSPVILVVLAKEMAAEGYAFYRSPNGVWLVDEVPPKFLQSS
ncbi:putative RNA 2'-phosphotransferase [Haloferula luteola]|uniref:Probable RNA 2'-phosphotransferase n=1 Tax=Haloferula luteola TaxID=595692 RepID=A0A840VC68_9BACT|nr:RNA 2'-phosphotransferase [Haloferula luteola]MBB5351520.1 putative RNA 2'-phosphotransferase [Haloferula luteola]